MQETQVWSLGREDRLEKGMATHFIILSWRIPWPEELGGQQSMGSHRVGHDWETYTFYVRLLLHAFWSIYKSKVLLNQLFSELLLPICNGHFLLPGKTISSCLPLCDPIDCSLPGSSVHGLFQARILEWLAISSSRESSWLGIWTHAFRVFCIGRQILYLSITWEAPQWRCVKTQTVFQISTDPFVSVS